MLKILALLIFVNIGLSKADDLGTQTDSRFDQVVPEGCKASWFGKANAWDALFNGGTTMTDNIKLSCNGKKYDYWYTNMSTALWVPFGAETCGKKTGAARGGVVPGSWWVQNPSVDENGDRYVEVCNSVNYFLWVQETCKSLKEKTSTLGFNGYVGNVTVTTVQIGALKSGDVANATSDYDTKQKHTHGDSYEVNGSGYMYPLFNNDCPYNNQIDSDCTISTIKSGYTMANNCYLLKNAYSKVCEDQKLCKCSTSKLISCGKCVVDKETNKIPDECKCDSDGKNCTCDSSLIVQCDQYFMPKKDDPLYKNVTEKQRSCYSCHSTSRTIYDRCSSGVTDAYKNVAKMKEQDGGLETLKTIYGPGTYICAFTQNGDKFSRIGCAKTKIGVPPKYFPRIARYTNNNNARNLFTPSTRVRQFRDSDEFLKKPQFGICGFGKSELGENYRGTFFKPKMHVVFGETDKEITFDAQSQMYTNGSPDMEKMYGKKGSDRIFDKLIKTPWNNGNDMPIVINISTADSGCNITQNSGIQARICTRIEYNTDYGSDSYVAYQVVDTGTCTTCSSCETAKQLFGIGSVPRPEIKYQYSKGNPIIPITIGSTNVAENPDAPNSIRIDPLLINTKIPQYHGNLIAMQDNLYPAYYDVKKAAFKNMATTSNDPSCTVLFGRKFCVKRDQCSILYDLQNYASAEINAADCKSNNCLVYKKLQSDCEQNTYCPTNFNDLSSCLKSTPQYLIKSSQTNLSYYQKNIQWQDETCLTEGFNTVLHSAASDSVDNKYGQYGDANYDTVIALLQPNSIGRPIRNGSIDDDNSNGEIVSVPIDVAMSKNINSASVYLGSIKDQSGNYISNTYFNTRDANAISSKISLRNRTPRELNLCGGNARDSYGNWDYVFNPGIGWYDIYMPLRCQFMEYELTGGQGGGTNLKNNAFDDYIDALGTNWGCKASWGLAGIENSVGNVQCRYKELFVNDKFNSSVGSNGGIAKGIINNNDKQQSFLSFFIGSGATNSVSGTQFCGVACGWDLVCPFQGNAYNDAKDSYIVPTLLMPSTGLTKITDISSDDTYNKFVKAQKGASNIDSCLSNTTIPGGNAEDNINIVNNDVYGNGTFISGVSSGSGIYVGSGTGLNAANNGQAKIRSAKVNVDGYNKPVMNGKDKQIGGSTKDPQCTPMCPRINMQVRAGSLDLICEYGGSAYNTEHVFVSLANKDFQVPAGFTAMPTRCFSLDGKTIYYPSTSYFDSICQNETVLDNNRFYGLCKNIKSSDYKTEFYNNDSSYWSMAGTYCPNNDCPVDKLIDFNTANSNIKLLPILKNQGSYGLKCGTGGMWDTAVGSGTSIRRIAQLSVFCPAIQSDLFDFPGPWSMNINWPKTNPGASATNATCRKGFIPNSISSSFNRKCGVSGIWQGVNDLVNSVCLYSCQSDTDGANYIKWDSPDNFSNPVSTPVCINGPVKKYVNGNIVTTNLLYVWPSGKSANDFIRKCNIPGAKDPMSYLFVNSSTTGNAAPSWEAKPNGAMCVPPSFAGACYPETNVCYDSAADGNISFASCYNNAVYSVNGIPTYPPEKKVSGNGLINIATTKLSIVTNAVYSSCNFIKSSVSDLPFMQYSQGAKNDFTCNVLNIKTDIEYYDKDYNILYYNKNMSIDSFNNEKVSTLETKYNDLAATTTLLDNINKDIPSFVDDCTLTANSVNYNNIKNYMISNNGGKTFCSQICYIPQGQTMKFYDCSETDNIPTTALCSPICSQTSEKWNYYNSVGLTVNSANDTLLGTMTQQNSQQCIKDGIKNAIPYLHTNKIDGNARSGQYCNKVSYTGLLPKQSIINTAVTNPIFKNKFVSSKLMCSVPQNCTLPNSLGTLNHQKSLWVWILDPANGFKTSISKSIQCASGFTYNIAVDNMSFAKLYCYDGSLFKVEQLNNLSYTEMSQSCFAADPTINDIVPIAVNKSLPFIKNLSSITNQEFNNAEMVNDSTNNSIATFYNMLPKLTA